MTDSGESFGTELKRAINIKTARGSRMARPMVWRMETEKVRSGISLNGH